MTQTKTFKEQYIKLSSIANELKTNPELDIDSLLVKVKEAVVCHKQCKARLEAATKELDSILQESNTGDAKGYETPDERQGDDMLLS